MSKLRIFGFVFIVVAVFGVIVSAAAFAAPEWLDNGKAITAPIAVLSELMNALLLEDMGPATEMECSEGEDEGTVGPGATGSTVVTECLTFDFISGQCEALPSPATITAEGLPWTSTLSLVTVGAENQYRVLVANMEFAFDCENAILGPISDLCEIPNMIYTATNDAATGTVLIETTAETETSSEGGSCHGVFGGKPLVLAGNDTLIVSDAGLTITISG